MPFQIDGRGDMNAFVLTSPLAGVMLLTRRQPFYPSAAHDKFFSICTAFGSYTKFGIAPGAWLVWSCEGTMNFLGDGYSPTMLPMKDNWQDA